MSGLGTLSTQSDTFAHDAKLGDRKLRNRAGSTATDETVVAVNDSQSLRRASEPDDSQSQISSQPSVIDQSVLIDR